MKITGSKNYIKFDLENGYVLKAKGELIIGRRFVVDKKSMKKWEVPHDNETVTAENIEEIIREVEKMTNEKTVQIIFE